MHSRVYFLVGCKMSDTELKYSQISAITVAFIMLVIASIYYETLNLKLANADLDRKKIDME